MFCWIQSPCQEPIKLDLTEIIKCKNEPVLSMVADTIFYIKLATNEECLIGKISQVSQIDDKIIIYDSTTKRISVFNKKGEFQNFIGDIGNGPGEYKTLLYGFVIDPKQKEVLINSGARHSIMRFDLNGKLKGEIHINHYFTNIGFIQDNLLVYTSSPHSPLSNNYLIEIINKGGKVMGEFHKIRMKKNTLEHLATVYNYGNKVRYWEKPWDAVFEFDGSSYRKHYQIEFGKQKMPSEFYYNIKTLNREFKKYLILHSFTEFNNFLLLTVFNNTPPEAKKYIYYPASKKNFAISYKNDSNNWSIEDDINGGPSFSFDFKISENAVCSVLEMVDLLKYKNNSIDSRNELISPSGHKRLLKLIESSSINDNPILQIVRLK